MRKVALVAFLVAALPASCSAMLPGSDALPGSTSDGGGSLRDSASPPSPSDAPDSSAPAPSVDAADVVDAPGPDAPSLDAGTVADAPSLDAASLDAADVADAPGADAPAGDAGPCGGGCDGAVCFEGVCGGSLIVQVSAGVGAACVLTKAGSVWCWGSDERGQLGVSPAAEPTQCPFVLVGGGYVACSPTPVEVAGLHDVTQISAGNASACAVEKGGSVWCWGSNAWGNLGHPPGADPERCGPDNAPCNPTPVEVTGNLSARMVSIESSNACVVTTNGEVACWGSGSYGQLGTGAIGVSSSAPQIIPAFAGVVKVAVQGTQACALKGDGSVWCWGGLTDALAVGHAPGTHADVSCGSGNFCAPSPTVVYAPDNATPAFGKLPDGGQLVGSDVSRGPNEACALVAGSAWCWGSDGEGVVGPAAGGSHFYPSSLPVQGATGISATNTHACAVQGDGGVLCWGEDEWGELGVGYQDYDAAVGHCTDGYGCLGPTPVVALGPATQVSAGFALTVALAADGTVWTWGMNDTGRLGHAPGSEGDALCTVPQNGQTYQCNPSPTRVKGLP